MQHTRTNTQRLQRGVRVTASDDRDGILTAQVVTVNPVDSTKLGEYSITYNVSDAAGNTATEVTRTVNVNEVVDPCANANATAQPAADFDAVSTDIKEWKILQYLWVAPQKKKKFL